MLYDSFLEDINNLLNSGEIPNLYLPEELEDLYNQVKEAAKLKKVILQNKEQIWNYFVGMVRDSLHIVLTFSPIGDKFKNKCRQFPSIINCSAIDWMDKWSDFALTSVGLQ